MKNKKIIMIATLGVAAVAVLLVFFWGSNRGGLVVHPKRGPIVEAVYGLGTVTSMQVYQLKMGVTASIKNVFVKEGEQVLAGAPLMSFSDGHIAPAPFSGIITEVPYHAGETVFANVALVTLINLSDRYVLVSLDQQGALRVHSGQGVKLSFESWRDKKFSGTVESVFPNKSEFLVRIDTRELPPEILPGMTADVAIEISKKDNALLIPVAAVSGSKVIVRRHGNEHKVSVEIGLVDGAMAEVVKGDLKPEDDVIIKK